MDHDGDCRRFSTGKDNISEMEVSRPQPILCRTLNFQKHDCCRNVPLLYQPGITDEQDSS